MDKDGKASVVLRNPDIASVKGRQICLKISAIYIYLICVRPYIKD